MAATKPGVLLQAPILPGLLEGLEQRYSVFRLWEAPDAPASFLALHAPSILALVCHTLPVTPALLHSLPHIQIVANCFVGVDNIDLPHCRLQGIPVTNTPDVLTDDVADLAILLMLAVLRRLCPADRYVRDGLWPAHGHFTLAKKASGLRVGIVGLGRIGVAIARRAEAFGCPISYYGRASKPNVLYDYYSNIVDLAVNSDVMIVVCPLTKDTRHLIGRDVLDALGPEGTLINIARGPVVDEPELVKALEEGRLGSAGLDVFENEPNVPAELLKMDNVVLTPHVGSATWETRRAMARLVLDNLDAHFSGKPLLTPVT